jgi:hypothetical protein
MTTHWLHQFLQVSVDKYIIIHPELFHTDSLLLLATRLTILGITSELNSHVRFDLYIIPTTWTWIKRNLAVGRWVPSIHSRGTFAREKIPIYQISAAGITSELNSHVRFDLNLIPTTWTKRNLAVGRWVPSIHSRGNFVRETILVYQISTAEFMTFILELQTASAIEIGC